MRCPPLALVAWLLSTGLLASAEAQEPSGTNEPPKRSQQAVDESIWGDGSIDGPIPRESSPVAAPILPLDWVALPRGAEHATAEILKRVLDPIGNPPSPGDAAACAPLDHLRWEARHGQPVAEVACAFTRIVCDADEVRMARLVGAGLLFVNGAGFIGDSEQRGDEGVPIALRRGVNVLWVCDVRASFRLELWAPRTRIVIGTWDAQWPVEVNDPGATVGFPLFNASIRDTDGLHVHYGPTVRRSGALRPRLTAWVDGGTLIPLGMHWSDVWISDMSGDSPSTNEPAIKPVCAWSPEDADADRVLLERAPPATPESVRSLGRERVTKGPLLVFGSDESLARARFDQQRLWYQSRCVPEAISDANLLVLVGEAKRTRSCDADAGTREALERGRLVLYGNAQVNKAWSRYVTADSAIQVRAGVLVVNGTEYPGDDISGWFVVRTERCKEVVAIADTGTKGARLGYLVQPLLSRADWLDYCFWDSRGENGTPRVFAGGKLTELPHSSKR